MPLTRYQIRNEFSLADPELYRASDKDDPEALLEGVAMAGLVGVLRQLGDLAEFAAEIFHDLHEEVMVTAARGHGLMGRVRQLEAEFPFTEKAFLSQTNHSLFFTKAGVDWHPNLRTEHNLITRGDLPRCVLDSYEECRGPPRLFLLDKFDVAGAGSCLKRYTDPSFFKAESAFPGIEPVEGQREKKARKVKKKGSRWRNEPTPEFAMASHAKLHQLFLEERIENAYNDPVRLVKLKRRQLNESPLDPKSGKSYMEKFLETPSLEHKAVYETSGVPRTLRLASDHSSESGLEIHEINTVSPVKSSSPGKETSSSSSTIQVLESSMEELNGEVIDREIVEVLEPTDNFTYKIIVEDEGRNECSTYGDNFNSPNVLLGEANSMEASFLERQLLDEVPSNVVKINPDLSDSDDGKYLADTSEVICAGSPEKHEVSSIALSADGSLSVDELDSGDTNISSDALPHLSDIVQLPSENRSNDPVDEILKTDFTRESGDENSANQIIDSRYPVTAPTGEQLSCSTLAEVERDSGLTLPPEGLDVVKPVNLTSEVDDATLDAGLNLECMFPMPDTSETCGFNEKKFSDALRDDPEPDVDPVEVGASFQEMEQNVSELFDPAEGEETRESTCSVNAVEGDAILCDFPSHCDDNVDMKDHVSLDNLATGDVLTESIVVSTAACGSANFDNALDNTTFQTSNLIFSPSGNLMYSEESLSADGDLCREELESNEVISQGCLVDLETEEETNPVQDTSIDLVSTSCKLVSPNSCNSEEDIGYLSLVEPTKNSLNSIHLTNSSGKGTSFEQSLDLSTNQQSGCEYQQERYPSGPIHPAFGLLPDATEVSMEEMPPLPPLPPMQWRIGRIEHVSPASQRELVEQGQGSFPGIPTDGKTQHGLPALEEVIEQPRNPFLPIADGEERCDHASTQLAADCMLPPDPILMPRPTMGSNSDNQFDDIDLGGTQSNPFFTLPVKSNKTMEYDSIDTEDERVESSSPLLMPATDTTSRQITISSHEIKTHPPDQKGGAYQYPEQNSGGEQGNLPDISVPPPIESEEQIANMVVEDIPIKVEQQFPTEVEEQPRNGLAVSEGESSQISNATFKHGLASPEVEIAQISYTTVQHDLSSSEGETAWPPITLALSPVVEDEDSNGNPTVKVPRPRNPLIDAVAAHDKSKLRKVTERIHPPVIPKVDERDSLLEQIRTKSFNLKPAVVTRPSIQGPKTNLRVAAILEKANAIRQQLAGSDDDDDEDGWSDS